MGRQGRRRPTGTPLFQSGVADARTVARAGYRAMMPGRTSVIVGLASRLLIFSTRFSPRSVVAMLSEAKMSLVDGGAKGAGTG